MKKKLTINSFYIRLVIIFMGILWLTSIIALGISFLLAYDTLKNFSNTRIKEKTMHYIDLSEKYNIEQEDLVNILEDEFISIKIYKTIEEFEENNSSFEKLTKKKISKLENGKLIKVNMNDKIVGNSLFFKVNNSYILTTQTPKYNSTSILINDIFLRSLLISSCFGTLIIIISLKIIIKPIKKLSDATKEISKGNFDININISRKDEVGILADNFNMMTKELKKIEFLRKDFISNVSHEFKTPMTSIQGFAKLIKKRNVSKSQSEEYLDIIISESKRLENLSSNLLKLTSLENKSLKTVSSKFSIDEQIRKVILLLEKQWTNKNIDFDLNLDKTQFLGDEELLQQVWINLINNAIKFSKQDGIIEINLYKENNLIKVTIEDKGIGISDVNKERIFEKFFKCDKSRNDSGNGLGLSITKKIIETFNGNIYFESTLDIGTVFFVELPY
jgi:signal transduction histidine kinase